MAKIIKKEIKEIKVTPAIVPEPVTIVTKPVKSKIALLTQNFGSEEIHVLRDKINEIINIL